MKIDNSKEIFKQALCKDYTIKILYCPLCVAEKRLFLHRITGVSK